MQVATLRLGPAGTEELGLPEDGLHGLFLEVGREAVLVQDVLHHDLDLGAGTLAARPVYRHALAHLGDELGRDDLQAVVPHRLHGGLVRG